VYWIVSGSSHAEMQPGSDFIPCWKAVYLQVPRPEFQLGWEDLGL
jgi:hypothetical protein